MNTSLKQTAFSTRSIARAGIIAAIYCVLTMLLQPISYGPVQFRVSEALTLLPVLTVDAVPGLFVGCLLANMLGGCAWYDIVFGSLATLAAAILTRKTRRALPLAAAWPVILNGLIVGPVVYFAYDKAVGSPVVPMLLFKDVGSVALGEAVICFILGILLVKVMEKADHRLWE